MGPEWFWTTFQIILVRFKLDFYPLIFYNLDLSKMIWTPPKQIGRVQNYMYSTKMIWTVQNLWPIEGQGIRVTTYCLMFLLTTFSKFDTFWNYSSLLLFVKSKFLKVWYKIPVFWQKYIYYQDLWAKGHICKFKHFLKLLATQWFFYKL